MALQREGRNIALFIGMKVAIIPITIGEPCPRFYNGVDLDPRFYNGAGIISVGRPALTAWGEKDDPRPYPREVMVSFIFRLKLLVLVAGNRVLPR